MMLPSGSLQIAKVRQSDQGAYRCVSLNPVTGNRRLAQHVVNLRVIGKSFTLFTLWVHTTFTSCSHHLRHVHTICVSHLNPSTQIGIWHMSTSRVHRWVCSHYSHWIHTAYSHFVSACRLRVTDRRCSHWVHNQKVTQQILRMAFTLNVVGYVPFTCFTLQDGNVHTVFDGCFVHIFHNMFSWNWLLFT